MFHSLKNIVWIDLVELCVEVRALLYSSAVNSEYPSGTADNNLIIITLNFPADLMNLF